MLDLLRLVGVTLLALCCGCARGGGWYSVCKEIADFFPQFHGVTSGYTVLCGRQANGEVAVARLARKS